ncbi:unnamed protein product [Orchesella dallaii]|uniref:ELM2 domain-containing protein n=1 Tax=Orchesella dallaii TaxID=48710 RepID=A0ABP1QVF0_9HEXA
MPKEKVTAPCHPATNEGKRKATNATATNNNHLPPQGRYHHVQSEDSSSDSAAEMDMDTFPPPSTSVTKKRKPKKKVGGTRTRVGPKYQAKIPTLISRADHPSPHQDSRELDTLAWKPQDELTEDDIEEFVSASRNLGFSEEQALGILCNNDFNLENSKKDLDNYDVCSDELSEEDKILFADAALTYQGEFQKIRQMLPHIPNSSFHNYYHQWEMGTWRKSKMDRPEKKLVASSSPTIPGTSRSPPSSNSRLLGAIKKEHKGGPRRCGNCRVRCEEGTTEKNLCRTCVVYWTRTGNMRGENGSGDGDQLPPNDMNINLDDLKAAATDQIKNNDEEEKEIRELKFKIRKIKQKVELARQDLPEVGAMSCYRRL